MPSPTVEFNRVQAVAETEKALCVRIDEDDYWVPKSQIDASSEVSEEGHCGTLVVSEWWAKEKRLV